MNVFFELADSASDTYGHKYFALYDIRKSDGITSLLRNVMQYSDRVWVEEESGVRFLKHRYSEARQTSVDMKEFFWIKLKSCTL